MGRSSQRIPGWILRCVGAGDLGTVDVGDKSIFEFRLECKQRELLSIADSERNPHVSAGSLRPHGVDEIDSEVLLKIATSVKANTARALRPSRIVKTDFFPVGVGFIERRTVRDRHRQRGIRGEQFFDDDLRSTSTRITSIKCVDDCSSVTGRSERQGRSRARFATVLGGTVDQKQRRLDVRVEVPSLELGQRDRGSLRDVGIQDVFLHRKVGIGLCIELVIPGRPSSGTRSCL